jgi:hypothetical protein
VALVDKHVPGIGIKSPLPLDKGIGPFRMIPALLQLLFRIRSSLVARMRPLRNLHVTPGI